MSNAWKIAIVATGSTAEMREPKAKDSTKFNLYATSAIPSKYIPLPITKAEIVVPTEIIRKELENISTY